MYESLTSFIPVLATDSYGEWIVDKENDGTPEHPIQWPFVNYGEAVVHLEKEIYRFDKEHPDFDLKRYNSSYSNAPFVLWRRYKKRATTALTAAPPPACTTKQPHTVELMMIMDIS
jgi:hypothetical protein